MKLICVLSVGLSFSALLPVSAQDPEDAPDFALSPVFLKLLLDQGIQPVLKMTIEHRTRKVHELASDCEMHLAATADNIGGLELADPPGIVVEPPNMCKVPPAGVAANVSAKKLREEIWPGEMDTKVMNRSCQVRGFPRIFTEHATSGSEGGANPNHVLEVHPALSIQCGSAEVNFEKALKFFPGMRKISPATARSCMQQRKLFVRFNTEHSMYEFLEEGGQCGNFVIVEVGKLNPKFVQAVKGGHSALARVSADGQSRLSVKIYTLESSPADTWLAKVKAEGTGNERLFLHGMLSYDYFAMVKVLHDRDTDTWKQPADWTEIKFPLAIVVFGEADAAPWEDPDR